MLIQYFNPLTKSVQQLATSSDLPSHGVWGLICDTDHPILWKCEILKTL